jgi:hypothetical protein
MNERPRIGQLKDTSEAKTKQWVLLVILMGFVIALSVARGHLVNSLVSESPGGTAKTCLDQLRAGPEAGTDVPGVGEAAMAKPPAQGQVCVF